MNSFKRHYIASFVVLGVMIIPGIIATFSDGFTELGHGLVRLVLIATPLVPLICKGGIAGQPKLAVGIAVVYAVLFGIFVGIVYFDYYTYGLEGPNGEGAPIAGILKTAFYAFFLFCPWLFTALRGASYFRNQSKETRQDAKADTE